MTGYRVPSETCRIEIEIDHSRFIATCLFTPTADAARHEITRIRHFLPDANHHVYAFRVGYGNSVTEGMSDDGEPPGTAGPPALAVLRGSGLGDVTVVITRYFGGKKLGKGGLVRAYSEAVRSVLSDTSTEKKIAKAMLSAEMGYPQYENVKRVWLRFAVEDVYETFLENVSVTLTLPEVDIERFLHKIRETTSGQVVFRRVDSHD